MTASSPENEPGQGPDPSSAYKRLERLVGKWLITGRTLNSKEDNINGRVIIEWLPGGLLLQLRGEMDFEDTKIRSLEIVSYDPARDIFPSFVYSALDEFPAQYYWDVQGDVVTHWTEGSKYQGIFSQDGSRLTGGWRPVDSPENPENTYDATMIRVESFD